MNREEMLAKLGLSPNELQDLIRKHSEFVGSLNDAQRAVVKATSPTLAEAAASFGPGATKEDLRAVLEAAAKPLGVTITSNFKSSNPEV